jgi:hypothetical protein
MNFRVTAAIGAAALVLVIGLIGLYGIVGHNNDQNWQVLQSPGGTVTVIDQPGYYFKGFGTVWTYPRTMEAFYSSHPDENNGTDESIRVTFNDAGNAQVSSYVRVQLPTDTEKRRLMHRDFQANTDYIKGAIRAHLVNCIKASGPVMSASENQSSRKAEFNQIVEEQLAQGLFKMRRTSITLDDLVEIEDGGFDEAGNKVVREKKAVVQATEIVNDASGRPIVIQPSPLSHYGLAQFSAKKESYLNAERSKAQRQEEVQQRLMIEEKGRRQIAEIEAEENQKKAKALIQAQQAAEVAEIDKKRAVTDAQRKVEVAMQSQREAETLKQIAKIEADTAELKKAATISVAEGKQKEIELGGGISDEKRVLAEIAAKRDVNVAEALSKVNVPSTVIVGGDGSGGSMTENLLNMALLKSTGILKEPVESK